MVFFIKYLNKWLVFFIFELALCTFRNKSTKFNYTYLWLRPLVNSILLGNKDYKDTLTNIFGQSFTIFVTLFICL